MKKEGTLENIIIPVYKLFLDYEEVVLDAFLSGKAKNGIPIRKKGFKEGNLYRIYDENYEFLCISQYRENAFYLEKAFWN